MLITGIGRLVTNRQELGDGPAGEITDAAIVVDAQRVAWVGAAADAPEAAGEQRIDVAGRCVVPGFVDAHTHLVFAGDRAAEFESRLRGERYDGGGIVDTVRRTRAAGADQLAHHARARAREAVATGTTTLEAKSGYGLSVDSERELLAVLAGMTDSDLPRVVPTFLGAHVPAPEFAGRIDEYVDLVIGDMLDACAPLARWCDVFCEATVFGADHARTVLTAGREHGLGLRLHGNQLGHGPGAQLAAEMSAVSADHLTYLETADIDALAGAGVVATLLPAAEFSTRSPYAPARQLLDAGVTVALATDCNPGSSYTTSVPFVIALACLQMHMSPVEALQAATIGGALALQLDDVGFLAPGAAADLLVLDAPSYVHLAYRPGVNLVGAVMRDGGWLKKGIW